MRFLLDTHVWMWLLESPQRVRAPVRELLEQADELVLSVASIWELGIKLKLGKVTLRKELEATCDEIFREAGARELAITSAHALAASVLPPLHRDPFDRMLIAQATSEGLVLVTADAAIRQYGTVIEWAI